MEIDWKHSKYWAGVLAQRQADLSETCMVLQRVPWTQRLHSETLTEENKTTMNAPLKKWRKKKNTWNETEMKTQYTKTSGIKWKQTEEGNL